MVQLVHNSLVQYLRHVRLVQAVTRTAAVLQQAELVELALAATVATADSHLAATAELAV